MIGLSYLTEAYKDNFTKDIKEVCAKLEKLKGDASGELAEFLQQKIDDITDYVAKHPPTEKKVSCNPTPVPDGPVYGLLSFDNEIDGDRLKDGSASELLKPIYRVQVFRNLETAKRAEEGAILQHQIVNSKFHPKLYKLVLQELDELR